MLSWTRYTTLTHRSREGSSCNRPTHHSVCSVCAYISMCAFPLGEQVAVKDVEQGHDGTVEEQEIWRQQRGGRGGRGLARGLDLRRCRPFRVQQGRHTTHHSGQLTEKHIRAHTHVRLDGTHTREENTSSYNVKTGHESGSVDSDGWTDKGDPIKPLSAQHRQKWRSDTNELKAYGHFVFTSSATFYSRFRMILTQRNEVDWNDLKSPAVAMGEQ